MADRTPPPAFPAGPPEDWPSAASPTTVWPPAPSNGPDGPDPSGGARRRWATWAAVVGAVLVVVLAVGWLLDDGDAPEPSAAPSSTTGQPAPTTTEAPTTTATTLPGPTTTAPAAPAGLVVDPAEVEPLVRFVEAHRGRSFARAVEVRLVDDAGLADAAANRSEDDGGRLLVLGELLTTLGATDDPAAVADGWPRWWADEGWLYHPGIEVVFVVGGELTAPVRAGIVAGLSQALDGQLFRLDREAWTAPGGDATLAAAAIERGVALWVLAAYLETLTADEQLAARGEPAARRAAVDARWARPAAVDVLVRRLVADGVGFVEAVHGQGGTLAVDAALASPPSATAYLRDPARYRVGDRPEAVRASPPSGAGAVTGSGTIGAAVWTAVLEPALGGATAEAALERWAGDSFVLHRAAAGSTTSPGGRCIVAVQVGVDEGATEAVLETWRRWTPTVDATAVGTQYVTGSPARLTMCR